MKHTLKLRALTEEYDEDYESRNDDFERYARHFLKTNVCRLTKDVWTIKTDCSYDEIYEFLEDHGWGFFEFISLDDFTNPLQLYDYVWEQRGKMQKSIPSIHEIFADHLLASQLKNSSVQKSKTAPKFSDMVKSARYGVSKSVKKFEVPKEETHFQYRGIYTKNKSANIFFNVTERKTDEYGHETLVGFTWTTRTSREYYYTIWGEDIQVVDGVEVITFMTDSGSEVSFRADGKVF